MFRKVFYANQLNKAVVVNCGSPTNSKSISAGGILFVKIVDGKTYLLLSSYLDPNRPLLDDLGGRTEIADESIFQTIDREVNEETNNIITVNSQNLKGARIYVPRSKYLCLMVLIDKDICPDTSIFGRVEVTNQIKRTIEWHEWTDSLKNKLNPRLKHKTIYDVLSQLS